jgi:DNA-binding NtrC family response regulator
MSRRILVIEDEEKLRRVVQLQLQTSGYEVEQAATAEDGLTDLRLPGMSGLEFLERMQTARPGLPVVVMTAFGSVEVAVEAMKKGAADFCRSRSRWIT